MIMDHIGIVVKSLERAMRLWESVFGYRQMTEPVTNTRQKVRVVFLKKNNSIDVKLIEPTDVSSSVFVFAKKGGGLHHLCFRCDELCGELDRLGKLGARTLLPPEPGEAFENEKIAFVYVGQGLNIELIDTDKRGGLIEKDLKV